MIKFVLLSILCVLIACSSQSNDSHMDRRDIEIFNQTPVWGLVKAIDDNNMEVIKSIIKNDTSLLNYQEPTFGISPLQRAVGIRHYEAAELLLELGANPNQKSYIGFSPIYEALEDGWYNNTVETDSSMLNLLFRFGADPNIIYESSNKEVAGEGEISVIENKISPLIYAISHSSGSKKIKSLLKHGADINYRTPLGTTPTVEALRMKNIEIAHLLIVDGHANISQPYYYNKIGLDEIDSLNPKYPIELLLNLTYNIPSYEYTLKKEIIQVFQNEGWDYDTLKENIPKHILERIKKNHPNDIEEYIQKY